MKERKLGLAKEVHEEGWAKGPVSVDQRGSYSGRSSGLSEQL